MRVWTVPIVFLAVVAASVSDEPSEGAMRNAFETSLAAQVQGAIEFVAETGGEAAVERVRTARTDQFTIRSFRKLDCTPSASKIGYVCAFSVDVGVVDGSLQHTLSGRFYTSPAGLLFAQDV